MGKFKDFKKWMAFNPPYALSMKEWGKFRDDFRAEAPIRYFFSETLPKFFLPVKWKMDKISSWVRYRIVRYHVIKTDLEPDYYEVEDLILHANFKLLKDFVEVQKGWMYHVCHSDEYILNWKEKYIPYYRRLFFRNAELGIKYLEWETTLDNPDLDPNDRSDHQAEKARQIHEMYNWWVNIRPNRKDIDMPDYDEQDLYGGVLNDDFDRSHKDYQAHDKAWKYQEQLEKEWKEEDTKYLILLINIREGLWT